MNPCLQHGFTACRGLRPLDPLCWPCQASKLEVNLYIGLPIHTNPVHIYAILTYPIPPCSILCTYIMSTYHVLTYLLSSANMSHANISSAHISMPIIHARISCDNIMHILCHISR